MTKLRVQVQVDSLPSALDIDISIPLDEIQARQILRPLNFPNSSSGLFCSDPVTIHRTMGQRHIVAKQLSDAIVQALSARDLIDGYPKDKP